MIVIVAALLVVSACSPGTWVWDGIRRLFGFEQNMTVMNDPAQDDSNKSASTHQIYVQGARHIGVLFELTKSDRENVRLDARNFINNHIRKIRAMLHLLAKEPGERGAWAREMLDRIGR